MTDEFTKEMFDAVSGPRPVAKIVCISTPSPWGERLGDSGARHWQMREALAAPGKTTSSVVAALERFQAYSNPLLDAIHRVARPETFWQRYERVLQERLRDRSKDFVGQKVPPPR